MAKIIPVIERIMGANDKQAMANRARFDGAGVKVINIMASPGAGKTSFIKATLKALDSQLRVGAIEGDLASNVDTEVLRKEGIPAVQINTGGGCHLDANQVAGALDDLPLDALDLVFIENVGNLICPVGFALGEHLRVGIASVPEGDDKPYKYPSIFANIDALIINKVDLLPYLPFDMDAFQRLVRGLNPDIRFFPVSCTTGEGIEQWATWLVELTSDN